MWRALALVLLVGCGGDDGEEADPVADDCDACSEEEFCQVRAEGDFDDWTERCVAVPEACDLPADCDCAGELYALCPDSPSSWACSDTFPPTIVTCGYN